MIPEMWIVATVSAALAGALAGGEGLATSSDEPALVRQAPQASGPLNPEEALSRFEVAEDLVIEPVLTEPFVRQPVFLNFDHRGRMWVVQYLQYPHPEGLSLMSKDQYWRAVYDKVPLPPPHHVKGNDKITIHEDTNGDGSFDRHKTFVDGLNITTAVVCGRGGVWVLNPPYLLFYPDADADDRPDGDPEVVLAGFGLEDTHSVANSLRWGPDGWLYAAQGSTVSAAVVRPGADAVPVRSMGQLIWRYHPETQRYEIFAEGGGNAFGVELDEKGRIYSGHNGGDTRGFHYVQGGYHQKGFTKHGPLSNPNAFGYFRPMKHPAVERFTHNFIIYAGGSLPDRYHGHLFGVEPLQGRIVESRIWPDGSSFQTEDISHPVTTSDRWFRPVDIKLGPDGAIYIADWYDSQVNHYRNHEGEIDTAHGRIYRLRSKAGSPVKPFDLSRLSSSELVGLLEHRNKWFRQAALRLLGDRRDPEVLPVLERAVQGHEGQRALESLWALHLSGGRLPESDALRFVQHPDPYVRLWTARLLGDEPSISSSLAARLADQASVETHVEARSQFASTARRLPAAQAFPVIRNLLQHGEDAQDVYIPLLLWWAVEAHADTARILLRSWMEEVELWDLRLMRQHIAPRLIRRYARSGTRQGLTECAELLQRAPGPEEHQILMSALEDELHGTMFPALPDELTEAMSRFGRPSLALRVRQGDESAIADALAAVADKAVAGAERVQLLRAFGTAPDRRAVPVLLQVASQNESPEVEQAALAALQPYDEPSISKSVISLLPELSDSVRPAAQTLLVSRPRWALAFLRAIGSGQIPKSTIPPELIQAMGLHDDPEIQHLLTIHWDKTRAGSPDRIEAQIGKLSSMINAGPGNPYAGKELYGIVCGACHTLFGEGGRIGPDLTPYDRDDLQNILLSVVHPNAEIREGFETFTVQTRDGRTLTGFVSDQDKHAVTLRALDGQDVVIPRSQIHELKRASVSLMPEGLVESLEEQQIRDLFAYLRSAQPLNN